MPIAAALKAKVYPDTKPFAPALQKYLTRIELRTQVKIPVKPVFDDTDIPERVPTQQVPKVPVKPEFDEKDLPKEIPTARPPKLPVELDPLTAAFQREVKRQTEALSKLVQVNVPVSAETAELRSDLSAKLAALQKSVSVKVPTEPGDRREYELKLKTLLAEVETHVKANIPVEVDETEIIKETISGAKTAEKVAPKIHIKAEVDKSSLSTIRSVLGSVGKGAGLTLLGAAAAQSVVGIGQFAAALAPAAGILVALPGIALAGAAALGVFKLATSGVGDAIGAGLSGDTKKFEEALAGLSPAAQSAARAVVALKPELDKLRASVQTQFFAGITQDIKTLSTVYLPILQRQLPAIAANFSLFTAGIVAGLSDAATSTGLSTLLGSVADGIGRASAGIAPLIVGFAQLATVAAPLVSDLGGGFASLATQFGTFLSTAANSGQLTGFLNTAMATLQQLGTILGNVGSIFSSVFQAAGASGGNLLTTLSTITGSVAAFFKTADGSAALQAVFSALAQVGKALGTALTAVLPALGTALVALAPSIGPLADALASVLVAVSPLLPIIGQLAGIIAQILTTALGNLVAELGPLIGAFAQVLGPILTQVSGAFKILGPLVNQVAQQFGQQLLGAFLKLAPTLITLVDTLVTALLPHLPKIAEVMGQIATAVGEAAVQFGDQLNQVIVALIPYLPQMVEAFISVQLMILQIIPPIIRLSTFLSQTIPIVLAIANAARDFGAMLGTTLRKNIDDAVAAIRRIGDFLSGVGTKIADFVTKTIPSWLDTIGTFLSELPGKIGSFLSALPGKLVALATEALMQMVHAVGFGIGLVVKFFIDLPGQVAEAFVFLQDMVSRGIDTVVTFFTELPGKVAAEVNRLWTDANALFDAGVAKAVAFAVSLKDRVVSTVSDLWARGKQLVSDGIDAVVTFFRELPQKSSDAVSSLPGKIVAILSELIEKAKTIGGQVVDGLVKGLKDAAQSALNAVKNLGEEMAKGFKEALGIHSPSRVFAALGEQIPAGLAVGMDRASGIVDAAVGRLAESTVGGFAFQLGDVAGPALAGAGTGGPLLNIEHFHAEDGQSPDAIAAALGWQLKGRG